MKECLITKNSITLNGQIIYSIDENKKVDEFLTKAYWEFEIKYPKFHKMDSVSKLGILTSSLLFNTIETEHSSLRTGIIITSHSGCQFTDDKYIKEIQEDPKSPHPALFSYTLPSIVMGEICIKHRIQGENIYMISENFERPLLFDVAKDMFLYKNTDQCLIGWVEVQDENTYMSHLIMTKKEDIQ